MPTLLQDLRYGLRQLLRNPGFTAVVVLTLALGISSTSAIFSVVDQVLLHPLPYADSDRLVTLSGIERSTGVTYADSSPANYLDWVTQNRVFSDMAATDLWEANLGGAARPERIPATMTTASLFPLFGISPTLGRSLTPQDETPNSEHVVVLSHGLWQRDFASDVGILGRNISLDSQPYKVVGVMPPDFSPDGYGQLWVPSQWGIPTHPQRPNLDPRQVRDISYLDVWAKLKPSVTMRQATADMDTIAHRLEQQYPDADKDLGIELTSLRDNLVGGVRPILLVLLGAVVFVLLIACANVANLLLARATARTKEISIRTALGASRLRLLRQLLTESVLLALFGGLLGALVAGLTVPALMAICPPDIQRFKHIGVNPEILGFTFLLSILSGILFGLAPAFQTSHCAVSQFLKDGERGSTGNYSRTRSGLAISEIGLSLVLLVGAGLLIKSFDRLMRVDAGFNPERVLTFNIGLPASEDAAHRVHFFQQVIQKIAVLPGVGSVGAVNRLPLSAGNSTRTFNLAGESTEHAADIRVSTPDYFSTMGIPLLKGRGFNEQDGNSSVHMAIVNETLARTLFPAGDAVGKYIMNFGPIDGKLQIIGVVANVKHTGLDVTTRPEVYLPLGQTSWPSMYVTVRSATVNSAALAAAVQDAVWSVDKNVPVSDVRAMKDVVASSVLRRRFGMLLLTIFAVLALALTSIGIYGVMSYSVSRRTHEIGIRMALGAQRVDVLSLIVRQGMVFVMAGIVIGTVASLGLTRLMSDLLFGVSATDPVIFVGVTLLLASVALAANYIPARRAAKVDPLVALRYE